MLFLTFLQPVHLVRAVLQHARLFRYILCVKFKSHTFHSVFFFTKILIVDTNKKMVGNTKNPLKAAGVPPA
jgi:hypothetical protein